MTDLEYTIQGVLAAILIALVAILVSFGLATLTDGAKLVSTPKELDCVWAALPYDTLHITTKDGSKKRMWVYACLNPQEPALAEKKETPFVPEVSADGTETVLKRPA